MQKREATSPIISRKVNVNSLRSCALCGGMHTGSAECPNPPTKKHKKKK